MKIVIGLIINLFTSILVSIAFYIFTKELLNTAILLIVLTCLSLISEKIKLLIDLKNPSLVWNSEYTMMKQNTNVMYELFYTVLITGVLLIISKIINDFEIYIFICLIVCIFIIIFLIRYIKENQKKLFKKVF